MTATKARPKLALVRRDSPSNGGLPKDDRDLAALYWDTAKNIEEIERRLDPDDDTESLTILGCKMFRRNMEHRAADIAVPGWRSWQRD